MRIAFIGPSGCGKTTLMRYVSETWKLPINPVGSRSVAREMGFVGPDGEGRPYDVDIADLHAYESALLWEDDHVWRKGALREVAAARHALTCYGRRATAGNPTVRPLFQKRLADAKIAWETSNKAFVTDRTPLDDLAYALMHCPEIVTDEFKERAFRHTRTYDAVFYCPLSAGQWLDDAVRVVDHGYHWRYDVLLKGLLAECDPRYVTLGNGDLGIRKEGVRGLLDQLRPKPTYATSTHALLHRLWTKAVGTSDYDKAEWMELERRLS